MTDLKLFMMLLGCRPVGRNTEQHDVFFTIAGSLSDTLPAIRKFWPDAGSIHIDSWREVSKVDAFRLEVYDRTEITLPSKNEKLFFLNLGGYREGEFEELHYKLLAVALDKAAAIKIAKQTAFFKHTGFGKATSHIDDKFGVDVDDAYEIHDILPATVKSRFGIQVMLTNDDQPEDEVHLGYLPLSKLE